MPVLTEMFATGAMQVIAVQKAQPFNPDHASPCVLYVWDGTDVLIDALPHSAAAVPPEVRQRCHHKQLHHRSLPAHQGGAPALKGVSMASIQGTDATSIQSHAGASKGPQVPLYGSLVPVLVFDDMCAAGAAPTWS